MAAETANKSTPSITTEEVTLATRYKQGGRTVYSLALTPLELTSMVAQPDPNVPNPGNRAIRESHAKDFANYYLDHDSWVIPGVILRAPNIFKFSDEEGNGRGVLTYSKRSAGSIQILDGQHRILGFHKAYHIINQRIESAKNQRSRALSVEGGNKNSAAVKEAERVLRDAEKLQDRFSQERVAVEIQVTDDSNAYRQLFFDIADNALGISASVKARFDTRKALNRALPTVIEHSLLKNRVEIEKDRLSAGSDYFVTAKHVADIIRGLELGLTGRLGKHKEASMNEHDVARHATEFLDDMTEAFTQLHSLEVGQITPSVLRSSSLLGSPAMLRILSVVYRNLTALGGERHWAREEVVDYFAALSPHMAGGAYAGSIWNRIETMNQGGGKQKAFAEGAMSPGGRRQDLDAVIKVLTEWAVLGKKGAPWVWAEPAPMPEPEKTEDQLSLAADIEADPELEALLADQAALEKKPKPKPAKK